jgi:hypothetical protein
MSRWDLLAEVQNGYLIVRVPGTSYIVMFHKPANSPQLLAKNCPIKDDHRAPMSLAQFLSSAWQPTNDKARELMWIV